MTQGRTFRPPTTDHDTPGNVAEAAIWLVGTPRETIPGSVVQELQIRFGLNACEAVAAIQQAQRLRIEEGADG